MRRLVRENALCASAAAACCAGMAWLGLYGFGWSDYETEVEPAYRALLAGHVARFLRLAPAYGGSLVERAPFALLAGVWGGRQLAVYRLVALPCLLAAAALAVWLLARMRTLGRPRLARAVALGVCVANPLTLSALELGHPEELLGACMCVAAVLLAARSRDPRGGRPGAPATPAPGAGKPRRPAPGAPARDRSLLAAGVLLGLAVANKQWALVAVAPVLLSAPPARRLRLLAVATATGLLVLAPLLLVGSSGFVSGSAAAAAPAASNIFKPWQLWWFFGHHSALALGPGAVHDRSYRVGPAWAGTISHPLILAAGVAVGAALWPRSRRRALSERDALLALALALLLRCVLDTWDEGYYLLPFVLALLAWEIGEQAVRPPLLALASCALAWVNFLWLPERVPPDAQAALFLAWTLPLAGWLGWRLLAPRRALPKLAWRRRRRAGAHDTTVSSLGRALSSS